MITGAKVVGYFAAAEKGNITKKVSHLFSATYFVLRGIFEGNVGECI